MTNVVDRSADEIAEGVASAMARMSVADLERLYAEDIVIWHNYDGNTQSKSENLAFLDNLFTHCQSVSYVDIDRQVTDRGYVQQHNLKVQMKDGRAASIPCCHVVQIVHGYIQRFDEYFDPAPMFQLMAEQP
jgi:ketosteroid isomerase-like protein